MGRMLIILSCVHLFFKDCDGIIRRSFYTRIFSCSVLKLSWPFHDFSTKTFLRLSQQDLFEIVYHYGFTKETDTAKALRWDSSTYTNIVNLYKLSRLNGRIA